MEMIMSSICGETGKKGNGRKCKRKVGGKNLKSVWWNNEIKVAVRKKEAAWKGVLAVSDEEAKERCMEAYSKEKRKGVYIRAKRK